ncbi:MAG TPA: hypothetical protein VHE30_13760 [Polyangiaceae bacterium]|nr:hypothetical protein [Polyangiaceae bacterium]
MDLEAELDELFRGPVASFVAGRNRVVKELRAAGRKDDAAAVGKLERPAPVAWVLNRLHFDEPELLAELRDAGAALKRAQETRPTADAYTSEREAHRAILRRATERAVELATDNGVNVTADLRRRIAMNLELVSAAEDVRPPPGRMVAELSPLGFDALSLDAPLSPPARPSREEAKAAAERAERLAPVTDALGAAEREARRLAREAELAEASVGRAEKDLEEAEARVEGARRKVGEALETAATARAKAEEAARAVEEARQALAEITAGAPSR